MVEFLLDTNAVTDFLNGRLPVKRRSFITGAEPAISVITHIEPLSNISIPSKEFKQLEDFINLALVYALSSDIVDYTIKLRQDHKIKTPDAIIAATALVSRLALVSRNVSDFKKNSEPNRS